MTQIELEAGLAQIELEYSQKTATLDRELREHRIRIDRLRISHELEVGTCKQRIRTIEGDIAVLKRAKLEQRAKLFEEYRESQQTQDTL